MNKSAKEGRPRKSVDKWEEAMNVATKASGEFREAEMKRQTQLINEANIILEEAMASLKRRYVIPTLSGIVSDHLSSNVVWMQFQPLTERSLL